MVKLNILNLSSILEKTEEEINMSIEKLISLQKEISEEDKQ